MSEQKLKSLKVVDLKDILNKAAVAVPAKANKQDLIARILASPAAIQVYNKLQNPNPAPPVSATATDDLLAPPEDFDWEGDEAGPPDVPKELPSNKPSVAAKPTKPTSKAAPKPAPSPKQPAPAPVATPATLPTDDAAVVDEELEKRKKRAARFGVPLVDSPKPRASSTKRAPRNAATPTAPLDNTDKLQARAARFGTGRPAELVVGKKRSVGDVVDAEELEKRKKRAERFGIASVGNKA